MQWSMPGFGALKLYLLSLISLATIHNYYLVFSIFYLHMLIVIIHANCQFLIHY